MLERSRWHRYAMVVGAACCWAAMAILAKLLFRDRGVDPLVLVAIRAYLPQCVLVGAHISVEGSGLRVRSGGLGCFPGDRHDRRRAAFGLFISGLKFLPPTQAGIVSMLEPVVAATAAFVILGESLFPLQIPGGGLVLASVVMVQTT